MQVISDRTATAFIRSRTAHAVALGISKPFNRHSSFFINLGLMKVNVDFLAFLSFLVIGVFSDSGCQDFIRIYS